MSVALVLSGGFATRLRPITLSCPKPIIDFANKPGIVHQMEALKRAGVNHLILAVLHSVEQFKSVLDPYIEKLGLKVTYSQEKEPLGTAGPLALARDLLKDGPFFVLNGDVFCDFPFEKLLQFHKSSGADGTILVKEVENPSQYGVVVYDGNGKISKFVEKPTMFVGNCINAGIYILEPRVLDLIKPVPTSIEKDVFPKIVSKGNLYCTKLEGFWIDIGNPRDYLKGHKLFLEHISKNGNTVTSFIHPTAQIDQNVEVGENVTIGENCIIRCGTKLQNCIIMSETSVEEGCLVLDSIISKKCTIGKRCKLTEMTILGTDCHLKADVVLVSTTILPNKSIDQSNYVSKIIL